MYWAVNPESFAVGVAIGLVLSAVALLIALVLSRGGLHSRPPRK